MAVSDFDMIRFSNGMQDVGMPKAQADKLASSMNATFVQNLNQLVTRDYLDARLGEQTAQIETRFVATESRWDARFGELEKKIDDQFAAVDARIAEQDAKWDKRIAEQVADWDKRFSCQNAMSDKRIADLDSKWERRFARVETTLKYHSLALAAITGVTVIPFLAESFSRFWELV